MDENANAEFIPADAAEPVQPVSESDVPAAPPVQVISVDELLSMLSVEEELAEDSEEVPVEEEPSLADQYFASALDDTSSSDTVQLLTEIRAAVEVHPLLTTDFADYTVTEGLLLALLLCLIGSWCIKMLKGGFSWLLS